MQAADRGRKDDAGPEGIAPDGVGAPIREPGGEPGPAVPAVPRAVHPAAGRDPDVAGLRGVEIPRIYRRVEDHALGDAVPARPAVPRPKRLSPRAGVERAAIRRIERERLDLNEAGHALARPMPGLPAVRRETHSVVAARGEHARLAGGQRERPRRHGSGRLQERPPRRAAIVADDHVPARELSRDRGPQPAGHGGIRDERGDVGPGKSRARRERLPRRSVVARPVEVPA